MQPEEIAKLKRRGDTAMALLLINIAVNIFVAIDPERFLWVPALVFIATGIVFLAWFRLAFLLAGECSADALEGLGARWAIASWFVPVLNLVFPFVIARRIWKALAERAGEPHEPPSYFNAWWGCLVVSTIASRMDAPIAPFAWGAAALFGAGVVNATTALAMRAAVTLRKLDALGAGSTAAA